MSSPAGATSAGDEPWEYSLHKYLLLLATMVCTITYTAWFTPPGGVWQDTDTAAGRLAGEPIIRDTSYHRYLAFYYANAAAFATSLVVIVLVLILAVLQDKKKREKDAVSSVWLRLSVHILRIVMVLDMSSLMAAYAAGTWQYGRRMNVYSSLMIAAVFVHFTIQLLLAATTMGASAKQIRDQKDSKDLQRKHKMLMLLATFAASVTYLAGLSTPGGFWDNAEGDHRPGVAILMGRHEKRLQAFILFNTMAFAASLVMISRLLDQNLILNETVELGRWNATSLYISISIVLSGLMGAYATGSCRKISTSFKSSALIAVAVLVFILFSGLQLSASTNT